MSTNRINKGKNVQSGKLLLKKQQISRQQLGGVTGGGEVSTLVSGALSIIGSASSSLETPSGVITGAVSGAGSAYDSNHLEDEIKDGSLQRAAGKVAGKANDWAHKHLHISF
jgi:hypothetical protein